MVDQSEFEESQSMSFRKTFRISTDLPGERPRQDRKGFLGRESIEEVQRDLGREPKDLRNTKKEKRLFYFISVVYKLWEKALVFKE